MIKLSSLTKRQLIVIAASTTLIVIGAALTINLTRSSPAPARLIAMFDGGQPGTPESRDALFMASDPTAKIDLLINYSVLNAERDQIERYLRAADVLGVKIAVSIKDLLGPKDLDPVHQAFHHQFDTHPPGEVIDTDINTDAQVAATVKWFDHFTAVWGYYIGDELPGTIAHAPYWMPILKARYHQVQGLSQKHILASVYNNGSREFLKTVKTGTQNLMMDYYPYPDGPDQTYGKVSDTRRVAQDTATVAGKDSWFALQGFSYYISEPGKIKQFAFPAKYPPSSNRGAPRAPVMVDMAQQALSVGIQHLAFFSYPYAAAIPGQVEEIKQAIRQIRQLPEFIGSG